MAALSILTACGSSGSDDAATTTTTEAPNNVSSSTTATPSTTVPDPNVTTTTKFDRYGKATDLSPSPVTVPSSSEVASLSAIDTPSPDLGERLVFNFEGETPPGFAVAYVVKPVLNEATGNEVALDGAFVLQITLSKATAIAYKGQASFAVATSEFVKQVSLTANDQNQLTWSIGMTKLQPYAVRTFRKPGAVVIDFTENGSAGGASSNL